MLVYVYRGPFPLLCLRVPDHLPRSSLTCPRTLPRFQTRKVVFRELRCKAEGGGPEETSPLPEPVRLRPSPPAPVQRTTPGRADPKSGWGLGPVDRRREGASVFHGVKKEGSGEFGGRFLRPGSVEGSYLDRPVSPTPWSVPVSCRTVSVESQVWRVCGLVVSSRVSECVVPPSSVSGRFRKGESRPELSGLGAQDRGNSPTRTSTATPVPQTSPRGADPETGSREPEVKTLEPTQDTEERKS